MQASFHRAKEPTQESYFLENGLNCVSYSYNHRPKNRGSKNLPKNINSFNQSCQTRQ